MRRSAERQAVVVLHRECPRFRRSRTQAAGGHAAQGSDLAKGSKGAGGRLSPGRLSGATAAGDAEGHSERRRWGGKGTVDHVQLLGSIYAYY
ncbi:probable TonB-dependent receptor [Pseudomonas aeruginosa NCMG1179]|nr:probable TonB-dependent receptor [Pseudomonas aeruginosa NCMG1179]